MLVYYFLLANVRGDREPVTPCTPCKMGSCKMGSHLFIFLAV